MKNSYLLLVILFVSFFTKIIGLSHFPTGMNNDELHFALNAKSVWLNFSNLADNWSPISLKTIPQESSSELSFLFYSPIIGPLPLNLFTARLPNVLISTITIFLLYLISKKVFNQKFALLVALLATINPWVFFFSRTLFDAPLAILFILVSIYLLISNKNIFLILISLCFAFYTYIGTKVLILPLIFAISLYLFNFSKSISKKKLISINIFTLILTLNFAISLNSTDLGNRQSELLSYNDPNIIAKVENYRNYSQSPLLIKRIFINRYTSTIDFALRKAINSFSPNLLFLTGDDTYTGSLWIHGYFYKFEIIFILLGLIFIFQKNPRLFWLALSLLLISTLPEALRRDKIPAYALHSGFQFPILIIISACGFYKLLSFKKNVLNIFLYLILFFSFLNFLDIYFFRYPYYAHNTFSLNYRLLSYYALIEKTKNPVIIVSNEPDSVFKNYLFYTNSLTKQNIKTISQIYKNRSKNEFIFDNITFTSPDNFKNYQLDVKKTIIIEAKINLYPNLDENKVMLNYDRSEIIYRIYNGETCSGSIFDSSLHSLKNLSIDPQIFCPKYFSSNPK